MLFCPRCDQVVVHQKYDVDIQHQCNSGNLTLDEEDVKRIGTFTDDQGNVTTVNEEQIHWQGGENVEWGTRAGVEGEDREEVTSRGNIKSTHFQRQHIEHIILNPEEFTNVKKDS